MTAPSFEELVDLCREAGPAMARAVTPRMTAYIPHAPTDKQAAFLWLPCEEALFGGAAGGGKTDALLMAALQYVDQPGYCALILRKTFSDLALPGAIMDRSFEWLAHTDARWSENTKTWTFPSGATLSFGYLETEVHKYRYQGSEFQYIAFDELTQFTESSYRYLFSRLRRREGSLIPLRMRCASNPGGVGHDWVKARFVDANDASRVFIPSKLADNPHLDQEGYLKALEQLDPLTRRHLLDGDWSARWAGSMFKREWFHVADAMARWNIAHTVRAWDLAASVSEGGKRTAGVKMSKTRDGEYWIEHVVSGKWTPGDRDRAILATTKGDGRKCRVLIEQEPGSGGIAQVDALIKLLGGYRVEGRRVTGDKCVRAGPVASQAEAGNVHVLAGEWNARFFDELEAFPDGRYADQVDALSLAFNFLAPLQPPRSVASRRDPGAERARRWEERLWAGVTLNPPSDMIEAP